MVGRWVGARPLGEPGVPRENDRERAERGDEADEAGEGTNGEPGAALPDVGPDGETERGAGERAEQVRPVVGTDREAEHERVRAPLQHGVAEEVAGATRAVAIAS